MNDQFIPGQRWINHAELQLGLGTVLTSEHRRVTLLFNATGETRTYSSQSAPLSRVVYKSGDKIKNLDGIEIIVQQVEVDEHGLHRYLGKDEHNTGLTIHETEIDATISLHGPAERMLAGLVDDNKWFNLRHLALSALNFIHHQPIATITGCRVDLVPHQLYIAREVSKRFSPRVLLADEVGLGKTIEAGLIIHQQLFSEQIQRVLIVVPDNLLHQWLVEMLRRFNLRFSLFDADRYNESKQTGSNINNNPFLDEQLVLCGLNTLTQNEIFHHDVLTAGWDMLVVDEAHHLEWSPETTSPAYLRIEQLTNAIAGVLLLTATPEQLGKTGHFARLRLLDRDRYHDYEHFIEEEKKYQPVAQAVQTLFDTPQPGIEIIKQLESALNTDLSPHWGDQSPQSTLSDEDKYILINHLLDLHGTGRVLFRNTRTAISGFPERQLLTYLLPLPEAYQNLVFGGENNYQYMSSLELGYQQQGSRHWIEIDPRIAWLIKIYEKLIPEKILLITHARQTVLELAEFLKSRHGIYPAIFHEAMTILERDRSAEYFADPESGARLMICSEIGSEGRNFQFAHHLILFDLPMVPDLLEQRIGRLDRIGQKYPVKIHVPYIESTAQEILLRWYRDGLGAFTTPCQTGQEMYQNLYEQLIDLIVYHNGNIDNFITLTHDTNQRLLEDLENGRDRLLEFNSCPPKESNDLIQKARNTDEESLLGTFMESAFDCFGIDYEEHGINSLILRPGENMVTAFPQLPDEGMTITYDRQTALVHENWHYISWTHPMVTGALDLALSYEKGNATAISFSADNIKPGTLLLECNYILQINPDQDFVLRNLIAPQVIRIVLDESGCQYQEQLPHQVIESTKSHIDKVTAGKIVTMKQSALRNTLDMAMSMALEIAPEIIKISRQNTHNQIQAELQRLIDLSRVNTNIRQIEIDFFEIQKQKVELVFDAIVPRLDAVRLLIAT